MSNNLTFAELEAQHVELLPARTVLSLFSVWPPGTPGTPGVGTCGFPCTYFQSIGPGGNSIQSAGVGTGGAGGAG
jgi:hypothetical protein